MGGLQVPLSGERRNTSLFGECLEDELAKGSGGIPGPYSRRVTFGNAAGSSDG